MKYFKRFKGEDEWVEVSKEKALWSVLGSYKDNEEVRSWLDKENDIMCMFAEIRVRKDGEPNG